MYCVQNLKYSAMLNDKARNQHFVARVQACLIFRCCLLEKEENRLKNRFNFIFSNVDFR
jgi:hypothetical protein